jgi:hypothetical protein
MFFLELSYIISVLRATSNVLFQILQLIYMMRSWILGQINEVHNFPPTACNLMFVHNMIQAPVYTPFALHDRTCVRSVLWFTELSYSYMYESLLLSIYNTNPIGFFKFFYLDVIT